MTHSSWIVLDPVKACFMHDYIFFTYIRIQSHPDVGPLPHDQFFFDLFHLCPFVSFSVDVPVCDASSNEESTYVRRNRPRIHEDKTPYHRAVKLNAGMIRKWQFFFKLDFFRIDEDVWAGDDKG